MLPGPLVAAVSLPMARFACTGCGDCCRGFAREAPAWEPEEGPFVRLSHEPGLPLMSWEWQRLQGLAKERGLALDAEPFDAVLDAKHRRLVVLSYRLGGLECPFFAPRPDLAPGPRSRAWGFARGGVCTVYEHRPLACRAFPLVPQRGSVALSLHCPELVDVDPGGEAELEAAYPGCVPAARAFEAAPRLALGVLERLSRAGVVEVLGDARALAAEAKERWPRVDLSSLAEEHGLAGWQELEARARAGC